MANFSLDRFKAEVSQRGLARTNRFEIEMPIPRSLIGYYFSKDIQIVNLLCEQASFPPQIIGVRPQRIYGPLYQRPFGVEYGGEGIPMTFLVDRQMDVKAFFDSWISKVVDPFQFFVYYRRDYSVDIRVHQLDENDKITYSVEIQDAFPRSVTIMELNNTSQNQFHRINVNFAYRKWSPVHVKTNRVRYPRVFNRDDRIRDRSDANKSLLPVTPQNAGIEMVPSVNRAGTASSVFNSDVISYENRTSTPLPSTTGVRVNDIGAAQTPE